MADTVHAQFPTQKNLEKGEMVTNPNNVGPVLNLVVALAMTVRRVLAIPGATTEWTVDNYQDKKEKVKRLSNADVEIL